MFANGAVASFLPVALEEEQRAVSVLRAETPTISTEPKPPVLIHTPTFPAGMGSLPTSTGIRPAPPPPGIDVPLINEVAPISTVTSATEHVAENTAPPPTSGTATTEPATSTQSVDFTVPIVIGGVVLVIVAILLLKHRSKGHDGIIPGA